MATTPSSIQATTGAEVAALEAARAAQAAHAAAVATERMDSHDAVWNSAARAHAAYRAALNFAADAYSEATKSGAWRSAAEAYRSATAASDYADVAELNARNYRS